MFLKVSNLTKYYGNNVALDNVSFDIGENSVIGLLGPNGAGKSTLMKIICCYLQSSAGSVEVCGYDTVKRAIDVKRRIGYLPEHNPLYLEMYVREYLQFVAEIYMPYKEAVKRTEEVIETVGLSGEANKKAIELSKGYRQRLGIAQAIINNPEILILDEPTSGLDPLQLDEIRHLIQQIGREKIVILSTHIMQEVEAICNRVIILNKGHKVGDFSMQQLKTENVNIESLFKKLTE